jgi:hypothetical protein
MSSNSLDETSKVVERVRIGNSSHFSFALHPDAPIWLSPGDIPLDLYTFILPLLFSFLCILGYSFWSMGGRTDRHLTADNLRRPRRNGLSQK